MTHLEFLNKNIYRKYPFQKTALVSTPVSNSCFVALRLNQCYGPLNSFFFSRLSCVNSVFYGNLCGVTPADEVITIGTFLGRITSDGQVLKLRQVVGVYAAGTLTIGQASAFAENFDVDLDVVSGGVEPTCVGSFTRPLVRSIRVHPKYNGNDADLGDLIAKPLIGDVTITTSGLGVTSTEDTLIATANNPSTIMGKGNKSLCAGNCDQPVIYSVNDVTPDEDGNIDIIAEEPIVMVVDEETGSISVTTPAISRDLLCSGNHPNQPPLDTTNSYYTSVISAEKTEWQTWPQYNA